MMKRQRRIADGLMALLAFGLILIGFGCASTGSEAVGSQPESAVIQRERWVAVEVVRLDQAPIARSQALPVYPEELRNKGVGGIVVVDFIVDTKGTVHHAQAIKSPHPAFGFSAAAAVAQWKYTPGMKDGHAVNVHMQVPITFVAER